MRRLLIKALEHLDELIDVWISRLKAPLIIEAYAKRREYFSGYESQLKHCPYCGGDNVQISIEIGWFKYSIVCRDCMFYLPEMETIAEAVDTWNKIEVTNDP